MPPTTLNGDDDAAIGDDDDAIEDDDGAIEDDDDAIEDDDGTGDSYAAHCSAVRQYETAPKKICFDFHFLFALPHHTQTVR